MNRQYFKLILDIFMFILFVIINITGFTTLTMSRNQAKASGLLSMHIWLSVLLIILIIIHLILNWTWIKSMFRNIFKKRNR